MKEWTFTLPNEFPLWKLESPWTPEFSKSDYKGQNSLDWTISYIIGNLLEYRCLNGLEWFIWTLKKHKLWPKEGLEIKLTIWFPTTKSREVPSFPCMQVLCYKPSKRSWQGLQLCFKPHLNQRFAHKVMHPKVMGVTVVGILGLPLGNPRTKWHLGVGPMAKQNHTIRGKVVVSSKSKLWWILWIRVYSWLVRASKCFNYALTNLLFSLCRSMWVAYQSSYSPSQSSNTPLYP